MHIHREEASRAAADARHAALSEVWIFMCVCVYMYIYMYIYIYIYVCIYIDR